MRRRRIRFLLLAFLIASATGVEAQPLRIVSVNVWSGVDYRGIFRFGVVESAERRELRFRSLVHQLRVLDPDVVFLQEVNPVGSFSSRLADSLSLDYVCHVENAGLKFGPVGLPLNFKEGNAILARHELQLELVDVWKLSGGPGLHGNHISIHFSEVVLPLVARITVGDVPIYLINVHLHAAPPKHSALVEWLNHHRENRQLSEADYRRVMRVWEKGIHRRGEEANRLLGQIKSLPLGAPVVVAGDFNADPDSPEILRLLGEGGFFDTYDPNIDSREFTWDPERNSNVEYSIHDEPHSRDAASWYRRLKASADMISRRIDYIFLTDRFHPEDVRQAHVVLDSLAYGAYPSDHFGVLAEIDIRRVLQTSPKDLPTVPNPDRPMIDALPILSYDTDVGLGYGGKAFLLHHLGLAESIDIIAFNSTKGERWYRFAFSMPDYELRQRRIYPLAVDFSIDFDKWIHDSFFGIGQDSRFESREYYTKAPLEAVVSVSRAFTPSVIVQLAARLKTVRNYNVAEESILYSLSPDLNRSRTISTSFSLGVRFDTRESYVNPSRGMVLMGEVERAPDAWPGNVSFTKLTAFVQHYSVLFYPKTVLALRGRWEGVLGNNLPVQTLVAAGGTNTLRGYPQDRFIDKSATVLNGELRFPIWWRFGGIAGYDVGRVWPSIDKVSFRGWASNPVVGLRFHMDTFVVRGDVGFGRETTGFYLNFGQVF